jgi:hypothetical protein
VSPTGVENLWALYSRADDLDKSDGRKAYLRYHDLLRDLAAYYGSEFEATVGAFCALSPNNDYLGNLRSLVSMLVCQRDGRPLSEATVSTYKHCRDRAALYLTGEWRFLDHAKGLKIRSFYSNIIDPLDPEPVTVDGHMICAWLNRNMTMSEAQQEMNRTVYREIAAGIRELAREEGMVGQQMQAVLWFARKRIQGIKYDNQLQLDAGVTGYQQTIFRLQDIKPF